MRHTPADLPSPIDILEARFADLQCGAGEMTRAETPREHAAPTRIPRRDDRPAGRMTLLPVE